MDPLVIIAGPTATGKSASGVELAKRLHGGIVSADSMQVYRGMDIGTAKITAAQMQGIPHALIDILEPEEEWNVVRFQQEAKRAVHAFQEKGRLPVLVGGTGFYIQSLLYDIDFTETAEDKDFRKEMQRLAREQGPETLHGLLRETDPAAAQAIHPNNVRRVIRALEYARSTGGRISEHNERQHGRPPAWEAVYFCLNMERGLLYRRIDARVDRMIEEGLLDEVQRLRARGLTAENVSMQGLGYRQLMLYLDGGCSLEEAVSQIRIQTKHFAKRQLTWFKRERNVIWLRADVFASAGALADEMERIVRDRLERQDRADGDIQGKGSGIYE